MQDWQTATSFQEDYTATQTIYPGNFSTEKETSQVYGQTKDEFVWKHSRRRR